MKIHIKLKWLGNWVALLVLSVLASEGMHFTAADPDPAAMQITLALICSWLAILLVPVNSKQQTQPDTLILWAVMTAAGFLALSLSPLYFEPGNHSLQLSGGVLILVLLFGATERLIRNYSSNRANSMTLFTLITGAFLAAPLYLSVFAEAISHPVLVDAIIAISPVSYLAGISEYDYLRSNWFYQHTPFGGLRFTYPSSGVLTFFYLAISLVLTGTNFLRNKAESRTLKQ